MSSEKPNTKNNNDKEKIFIDLPTMKDDSLYRHPEEKLRNLQYNHFLNLDDRLSLLTQPEHTDNTQKYPSQIFIDTSDEEFSSKVSKYHQIN